MCAKKQKTQFRAGFTQQVPETIPYWPVWPGVLNKNFQKAAWNFAEPNFTKLDPGFRDLQTFVCDWYNN